MVVSTGAGELHPSAGRSRMLLVQGQRVNLIQAPRDLSKKLKQRDSFLFLPFPMKIFTSDHGDRDQEPQ
jgi:hypothetical protein